MAAVLATARSFGPIIVANAAAPIARPARRVTCRWVFDPESGKLVCVWDEDPLPRQFVPHLRLVKA